jgi:diaminopimelate decarboxylase
VNAEEAARAEATLALAREHFRVAGGELQVGGVPVSELARAHGTPLYVYDGGELERRLDLLRAHLPAGVDVFYSAKANPNPAVLRRFVGKGAGIEIASAGEYVRARAAGCAPERILFAGPGKTREELAYVLARGVGEIHAESDEELAVLAELAAKAPVRVAVRVNPSAEASGGAMRMGGQPAPFGFDEERLEEVARRVAGTPGLRFTGVHMFAGTQILDARVLVGQWAHALETAARCAAWAPVETVDLGGGLGIPYFANERALDLAALKREAGRLFAALPGALARARVVLEPGRFLAGPAGVYLARVLAVKRSRGRTFVVLDGGMNHHLAASGNLGQVIKRDYPVLNASRADARAEALATVVGPLCTPLDTLARQVALPPTFSGDLVAVLQSGAYGLSASPLGFLSHPSPAEVLADRGGHETIRARGTFEAPLADLP